MNQAQTSWEGISSLQNTVSNGFAGVNTNLCNGFAGINTNLCNGFAGVNANMANGFAQAEIAANARQIADMQQAFASQTANTAAITGLGSQLASCCCENRLATANLNSTIIAENCADREALNNIGRDIIAAVNANTQSIKDQLCQDKIDAKNDTINQLRSELLYARGQASQDVQTASIQAGQRALANEVEQYVAPKAVPAYIVQNPNCCAQNYYTGCGCGMG